MIRTLSGFCVGCLLTAIIVFYLFPGEKDKEDLSFRVAPQGSFPGFHIQSYEFSIPLNRMELTALVHADDPEGFYGSGGAPMTIIVFRVKENGEFHYFALSGAQESRISEFQYLGKELELKNWAPAGAGFLKLDFLHKDASHASAWLSSSQITGSPAEDAAGEPIALDTRWLHADTYDKHAFEGKSFPVFLAEFTNMPHGMNQIRERTGGAAQQHFNVGGYKALRCIMPPIELQNQFATFVAQTDKSKVTVQRALDETKLLFDSLIQKYFG